MALADRRLSHEYHTRRSAGCAKAPRSRRASRPRPVDDRRGRRLTTLRAMGRRGDIIKRMRALTGAQHRARIRRAFSPPGSSTRRSSGRLVDRGLDDELKGTAYAVVDGVDGRTHHIKLRDLDSAGDSAAGSIVELRQFEDAMANAAPASPSDPISASTGRSPRRARPGSTVRTSPAEPATRYRRAAGGEVRGAMRARADHRRTWLWRTPRPARLLQPQSDQRRCASVVDRLRRKACPPKPARPSTRAPAADMSPVHIASAHARLSAGSAMIDDGLGFQLVPPDALSRKAARPACSRASPAMTAASTGASAASARLGLELHPEPFATRRVKRCPRFQNPLRILPRSSGRNFAIVLDHRLGRGRDGSPGVSPSSPNSDALVQAAQPRHAIHPCHFWWWCGYDAAPSMIFTSGKSLCHRRPRRIDLTPRRRGDPACPVWRARGSEGRDLRLRAGATPRPRCGPLACSARWRGARAMLTTTSPRQSVMLCLPTRSGKGVASWSPSCWPGGVPRSTRGELAAGRLLLTAVCCCSTR